MCACVRCVLSAVLCVYVCVCAVLCLCALCTPVMAERSCVQDRDDRDQRLQHEHKGLQDTKMGFAADYIG